ncbi:MAG TPA: TetR/AcrR family transcriptional regulator [Jatrophihabitantaceae bacterium]|jgi:AcrR family transcriptional regulator
MTSSEPPRLRSDTLATRKLLQAAVLELVAECGVDFQLADVAKRAGTSTATAYRHFANRDAAIEIVIAERVDNLCRALVAVSQDLTGWAALRAACDAWVRAIVPDAPAVARLRSSAGLLERLHVGESAVTKLWDAISPILRELIELELIPPRDVEFLFLCWNSLFDERNLLDLHETRHWPVARIVESLTGTLIALLESETVA